MDKSEVWPIDKLKFWAKNPRGIKDTRFQQLKTRLKRQGQLKPLLVNTDGIVIGGNMRLMAIQQLGWPDVWVSVVDAKTDKQIFDIAMTDNEEFGYYEEDQLAELALSLDLTPLELSSYELHISAPIGLNLVIDKFAPSEKDDNGQDQNSCRHCPQHCGE